MIFTTGLKRICDICFYMTFASLIGIWLGGTNLIITLPFFAVTALLSAFLSGRGRIKYISFAFLPLCFLIVPFQFGNVLVLLPAFVYMVYAMPKSDERSSQFAYTEVFKLFFKLFVGLVILATVFHASDLSEMEGVFDQSVFPFGIAFFLCSITLLRMLRHDEQILNQHRFKLINVFSLIGLIVGAILVSSDTFLNALGRVAHFLYFGVFLPMLSAFFNLLLFVLSLLPELPFMPQRYEIILPERQETGEFLNLGQGGRTSSSIGEVFRYAFYVLIVIIGIFIVMKTFQQLAQKYHSIYTEGPKETRVELSASKKPSRKERHQPKHQIREVYRKYLQLCVSKGIPIEPYMTSLDIENVVMGKFTCTKSKELREIYIKVRYRDNADYNKEDMKRAKMLLKDLRREWNGK